MPDAIRKLVLVLVVALLAFFGVRALYHALASPEKKIRWRLEAMVEGFNARRAQPVLDGIAKDFVDRTSSVGREELRSMIISAFFNELDEKGEFLWKAVFDPKETTITLAPDKHSAAIECRVQFFRRRGPQTELDWDAHIAGTVALGEEGWQWSVVTSANHEARQRR